MQLHERQKKLLWVVVQEFINSAQPVGSANILEKCPDMDCSSATIRKELSFLEEEGYLTHPHTSAGRIPTDKGYRFYVDHLMKAYKLTMREKALLDHLNQVLTRDANSIMEETLRTVQNIASYATAIKTNNELLAEITGQVNKTVTSAKKESLYVSGLAQLLYEPEFDDVNNVRRIANVLEEKERFSKILDDYSDPEKVNIVIGHELKDDALKNYSLVTKEFHYKGEPLGFIGVLGPTRMRYSQVTSAIDTIAHLLDDFFNNF